MLLGPNRPRSPRRTQAGPPGPTAPGPTAPGPTAPGPMGPGPVAPGPIAPQPPGPKGPGAIMPQPGFLAVFSQAGAQGQAQEAAGD